MAVLPLWNGSQANPTRGSKFLVVGLCDQKLFRSTELGSPGTEDATPGNGQVPARAGPQGRGVVGDGKIATSPYFSVGIVATSYRNPKLMVKLERNRQSSWKYPLKTLSR